MQKFFFIQIVLMGYILFPILIVCVSAQKSIGNGISINQTELFKVLQWIQNEEIYMWYGAECDDLDCIENFETLINAISNGLLTSSGELYIHYKKSNKK